MVDTTSTYAFHQVLLQPALCVAHFRRKPGDDPLPESRGELHRVTRLQTRVQHMYVTMLRIINKYFFFNVT